MGKKATNEQLIESYKKLGSVWEVAKIYGMCGQGVHARLKKLNIIETPGKWTSEDEEWLVELYDRYNGRIELIKDIMNRSYASIACKANELGMGDRTRRRTVKTRIKCSLARKAWFKINEHPRGFLGHKHSERTKKIMADKTRDWHLTYGSSYWTEERKQINSDRAMMLMAKRSPISIYSRGQSGYYDIDGTSYFFRSSWEAMYARYLNILISFKIIKSWLYEPDTFWFEKIKRGVRSYKPDFKVLYNNGDIEYHEVKGWMDDKSKTKIKRMALYYPDVKLIIIGKKEFNSIRKKFNVEVNTWIQ